MCTLGRQAFERLCEGNVYIHVFFFFLFGHIIGMGANMHVEMGRVVFRADIADATDGAVTGSFDIDLGLGLALLSNQVGSEAVCIDGSVCM